MKTKMIKRVLITFLSFFLFLSLTCLSAFMLTNKTTGVIADDDPVDVNVDYVDSPIAGRTSWTNASRPLGFVLYLKDVTFATAVHLQNGVMTAESLAKITFTRGNVSQSSPVLVCVTKDGGVNKSCFCFFFGGALVGQTENTYIAGDTVEIAAGCILKCTEGSFNVPQRLRYEYDGSSWVFVREEKVWNVSGVSTSAWVHPTARPLGVDVYRSAEDRTAEPLDQKTDILTRVNDATKVTYTRNGVSENPVIIIGTNAYVAYCFAGSTIGATDTTPQNGDLFTIETGFKFRYYNTAFDYNRYYSVKLQYEYFNGIWKACTYTGRGTWENSSISKDKSGYSSDSNGMVVVAYGTDKTISAGVLDGIQTSVFDLTKITFNRQGTKYHPNRIIANNYVMNYFFRDLPNTETFVSGDMLIIEEGFSFIYNNLRYTYGAEERYVFTGSSWQVPSLSADITHMSVRLNENINALITCTMPVDIFDDGTNRIFLTVYGSAQKTILVNAGMEKSRADGLVSFVVPVELNPTLLTADIQLFFRSDYNSGFYFSNAFHLNVKDYCDRIIENNASEEQVELVKALLNYGGYAQTYFNVNTDNLANAGLYPTDDPIDSVTVSDTCVVGGSSATGLTVTSHQLYSESMSTLRFYFTLDGGYDLEDYIYRFKLDGSDEYYYLNTEDGTVGYDETVEKYYFEVANIPAKYMGTRFTAEVKNKSDNSIYTIETSVYCYIKIALNNGNTTEAKANMLKALYVYGTSATAFVNAN